MAPAGAGPLTPSAGALRREGARKAIHLLALVFPLGYHAGASWAVVTGAAALALGGATLVELARRRSARVAHEFTGLVGGLLRPHERQEVTGATWLALGLLLCAAVLPRPAAVVAMWCAVAADAAAGLVGGLWQRSRDQWEPKSVAGSVAALIVAFAGAVVLGAFPPLPALAIALSAAVAERWGPGDDNLRVAIASGLVALAFSGGLAAPS